MSGIRWNRLPSLLIRGLAIAGVGIVCFLFGWFEGLERLGLNGLFTLRGPILPASPIVIVSIDEDSFDELQLPWPWPRSVHAQLVQTLAAGHPAAIGLDVLFAEPSLLGPEDDQALGKAIKQAGHVVLAAALSEVDGGFYRKEDLNPPIPVIRTYAAGYGPANLLIDEDAVIRQAQLRISHQNQHLKGLDLLLYEEARKAGIPGAPLPRSPFWINFRGGPHTFVTIPYYRVLTGEIAPERFRDHIVLVGATSPLLHDLYSTPFALSGDMPGVEIHANVLETLLQGIAITRVPWSIPLILLIGGGLLAVGISLATNPLRAGLMLGGLTLGYWFLGYWWFVSFHVWLDLVPFPFACIAGYSVAFVERFLRVQRDKRRLALYFSPTVLNEIVHRHPGTTLNCQRRIVTVLFADIRGFTTLTEQLPPEKTAIFLRTYLTDLTEIIFQHGGMIDKYMGDAIMALYNAPLDQPAHANHAVLTALAIQRHLPRLADALDTSPPIPLACGIGIHTGEALVGTIGSAQRFEYTAIGDSVNLAARLETLTKTYGVSILISESTYKQVQGRVIARFLDEVTVKGTARSVKIYTVLDRDTRHAPRVVLKTGTVRLTNNGQNLVGTLNDLSLQGLSILDANGTMHPGDEGTLSLTVPTHPHPLIFHGQVIWRNGTRAGLRVVATSSETRHIFHYIMARMLQ
ncbi:MAG: CHASE2 domain-containing protein [Nitrospirae bacterium]|nr:MAG: CHASE2 domain-containing protein [Nitrospirota bacterium]